MVEVNRALLETSLSNLRQSVKRATPDSLVGVFNGDHVAMYQEGYVSVWENVPVVLDTSLPKDGEDGQGYYAEETSFFSVDGDDFYNVVSRIKTEDVELKMNKKSLTVKGGKSSVRVPFVESVRSSDSTFPPPEMEETCFNVSSSFFSSFSSAKRFVAKTEAQPMLTCLSIRKHEGMLTLLATDGLKLFYRQFSTETAMPDIDVLLPDSCIDAFNKVFSGSATTFSVTKRGRLTVVTDLERSGISTTGFNGQYPNAFALLENEGKPLFRAEQKDFMDAVRLGAGFSKKGTLTLRNTEEGVQVFYGDGRLDSEVYLESAKDIQPFEDVKFNSDFLLYCLDALGNDVEIRQQDSGALRMTTYGGDKDGKTITLLYKII